MGGRGQALAFLGRSSGRNFNSKKNGTAPAEPCRVLFVFTIYIFVPQTPSLRANNSGPVSVGQTVPRSTMGAQAPTPLGTQAGLQERRTPGARTLPEQGGGLVLGRSLASAVSCPRFFLSLPLPLFGVGFGFRRASGSLGSRAWRWGPHPGIAPLGASRGAQGFCTQRRRVYVAHACGCGCGCGCRAVLDLLDLLDLLPQRLQPSQGARGPCGTGARAWPRRWAMWGQRAPTHTLSSLEALTCRLAPELAGCRKLGSWGVCTGQGPAPP